MKKTLMSVALKLRRLYWWFVRPVTRGVRAILVNEQGKILLVRHTYGEGWFLPGGKTGRNEKDEDALKRELREELGIHSISKIQKFGEYENTQEYKKDTVVIFVIQSFTMDKKHHFEIDASNFFDPLTLPKGTSPGTKRRIEEWLGQRKIESTW